MSQSNNFWGKDSFVKVPTLVDGRLSRGVVVSRKILGMLGNFLDGADRLISAVVDRTE